MSIEVTIKQKGLFKKALPLEVILGDSLAYGSFMGDTIAKGELGETEFLAYNPEHIGRGISVVWNEREKREVKLRLLQPSTPKEMLDFYNAVKRIAIYWKCSMTVDGVCQSPERFASGFCEAVVHNENIIKHFSREVLDGRHDTLTLYSAMWPLVLRPREAARFAEEPGEFYDWLHERQSVDATYATPMLFRGESGNEGRYLFVADTAYIFPKKPTVPFGTVDPGTGVSLVCDDWRIWPTRSMREEPIGELAFDELAARIPPDKLHEYDCDSWLIDPLCETELEALIS